MLLGKRRFLGGAVASMLSTYVQTPSWALTSASVSSGENHHSLPIPDTAWLNRISYGANSQSVTKLANLGRKQYLAEQLKAPLSDPPELAKAIAALHYLTKSAEDRLFALRAEQQRIRQMAGDAEAQRLAGMAIGREGDYIVQHIRRRHLLRALYSPAQLRERLTWFWMNHFSVYNGKAKIRWTLAEYEEYAIRPHALGRFRDLVLSTLTAPAMLEFLDNAQSTVGKVNENYARELMELHTLGIAGGPSGSSYSQKDVQELARILTGVGIYTTDQPPKLPTDKAAFYRREGLFEFNPLRHDFGTKTFLGKSIKGIGFSEVEQAVDILVRDPACARFIAKKLAIYFVADNPPPTLINSMAQTFQRTGGDIAAVLQGLFLAPDFDAAIADPKAQRLKDPMRYVVSSLRLAYAQTSSQPIPNLLLAAAWLQQLGAPLYGRMTPDGFPLTEDTWTSSEQMIRRFEIAKTIGTGGGSLFNGPDGKPIKSPSFPQIANRFYFDHIEPMLSEPTRNALQHATTQAEWNTVLLSSPEWMKE